MANRTIHTTHGEVMTARFGALALLSAPLPVKLALRVAFLARQLKPHVEALDTVRKQLLKEFGVLDEATGDPVFLPNGEHKVLPGFHPAWEEAKREPVAIEQAVVLSPADLPEKVRGQELVIEGIVFDQLGPFFEDA